MQGTTSNELFSFLFFQVLVKTSVIQILNQNNDEILACISRWHLQGNLESVQLLDEWGECINFL